MTMNENGDKSEDYFAGLLDRSDDDPSEAWQFNRWQATALGGMSLSIVLTVIGAGLRHWLAYTSVMLAAVALPTLIIYLMLESDRMLLRSGALVVLFGVGQAASVLGFLAFIASYSWLAIGLAAATFAFCLWWFLCRLGRHLGAELSARMMYPEPQFHRTKMDRLLWAICATVHELKLQHKDFSLDESLQPSDFDGTRLKNITFVSPDIEARFQAVLRRKLKEAAAVILCVH